MDRVAATAQLTDNGSGTRRITAQGTATGLSIGNAQVDPLLAGQTTFDLAATQSPAGIAIERLIARNGQLQVTTSGNPRDGLDVDASLSNLALLDKNGKATRVGFKFVGEGENAKKVRFAKTTGDQIDG